MVGSSKKMKVFVTPTKPARYESKLKQPKYSKARTFNQTGLTSKLEDVISINTSSQNAKFVPE